MQDTDMLENLEDPRSCVCFLLSRAAQAAQRHLRALLEPYGITPAQYLILECLWIKDGMAPKSLGDLLKFDSATLTGLIDRLDRAGLVQREPDPQDRRAIRVRITEKAKKLKKPLRELRLRANEEILEDFLPENRETLKKALLALISRDEPMESL